MKTIKDVLRIVGYNLLGFVFFPYILITVRRELKLYNNSLKEKRGE